LPDVGDVVGVDDARGREADALVRAVAKEIVEGRIGVHHHAVGGGDESGDLGILDNVAQQGVTVVETKRGIPGLPARFLQHGDNMQPDP
jgi:hypothetical protein